MSLFQLLIQACYSIFFIEKILKITDFKSCYIKRCGPFTEILFHKNQKQIWKFPFHCMMCHSPIFSGFQSQKNVETESQSTEYREGARRAIVRNRAVGGLPRRGCIDHCLTEPQRPIVWELLILFIQYTEPLKAVEGLGNRGTAGEILYFFLCDIIIPLYYWHSNLKVVGAFMKA